tara:strand:- start:272 stop:514 length:243 start_codon:yes stop_codon:yes gene_type:complete
MTFKNGEERLKRLDEAMKVIAWDFRKPIALGLMKVSNERHGGVRQLSIIVNGKYIHLSDETIKELSESYSSLTETQKPSK